MTKIEPCCENQELIQDNGTVCINCGSQHHYATVNEYKNF